MRIPGIDLRSRSRISRPPTAIRWWWNIAGALLVASTGSVAVYSGLAAPSSLEEEATAPVGPTQNSGSCPSAARLTPLGCRCYSGPRLTCKGNSSIDEIVRTIGTTALKELNLSEFSVDTLPASVCDVNVEELVVSHSKLRSLGPLDGCNFTAFSLDNTTIEKADKIFRSLRGVNSLIHLSFLRSTLDLSDIEQIKHLGTLNIYKCNFTLEKHLRPLNSLRELQIIESDIGTKHVTRDQLPDSPTELQLLRLIGLGLYSLPDNLLIGIPSLQKLDISKNHLVDLEPSMLASFHGTLVMQGNPWHCDDLVWLRQRAAACSLRLFTFGRIACATPPGTYFDQIPLPSANEPAWMESAHELVASNREALIPPMALCVVGGAAASFGVVWAMIRRRRRRRSSSADGCSTTVLQHPTDDNEHDDAEQPNSVDSTRSDPHGQLL